MNLIFQLKLRATFLIFAMFFISPQAFSGTAFLESEKTEGIDTYCIYDYLGESLKKKMEGFAICPLSIEVEGTYGGYYESLGTEEICLTYMNTQKNYKVRALVKTGSYLNQKTNSINYSSLDWYIIVFWGKGKATVIYAPYLFSNNLPVLFDLTAKDQNGVSWRVRTNYVMCY